MPRPVLALAVVPLVLVIGFQSAWAFVCAAGTKARDHCCCKSQQNQTHRGQRDDVPSVKRQDCCQVASQGAVSAPVVREAERVGFEFLPAMLWSTPVAMAPMFVERRWAMAEMARPPPVRVPIYIDHQALLR